MSNYVPWYGKKREKLAQRRRELVRLLQLGGSDQALTRAAEEVRASRIRYLKAQRARIPQCGLHDARLAEFDREIALCESTPIEAILAEYRAHLPKRPQAGP